MVARQIKLIILEDRQHQVLLKTYPCTGTSSVFGKGYLHDNANIKKLATCTPYGKNCNFIIIKKYI